jgi:enoyl-CoA hydratase/carnithine racemase
MRRVLASSYRRYSAASVEPLVTVSYPSAFPRVAVLCLNDGARLNALTEDMGDSFGAALSALDYRATGAVVLTGAGRAFSAGGDLAFLRARAAAAPLANASRMRDFYARFLRPLRACRVPVVAAVHGAAIGAGAALATAADVRCVAAGARVGFSFAQLGIHAGMGSTHFLPRAVGPGAAARLLLTGETVGADEAAALGWALRGGADDALRLAAAMARGAPAAVRGMTRTLRAAADAGLQAALDREAHEQAACYATEDFRLGLHAVAAKAPTPDWVNFE